MAVIVIPGSPSAVVQFLHTKSFKNDWSTLPFAADCEKTSGIHIKTKSKNRNGFLIPTILYQNLQNVTG